MPANYRSIIFARTLALYFDALDGLWFNSPKRQIREKPPKIKTEVTNKNSTRTQAYTREADIKICLGRTGANICTRNSFTAFKLVMKDEYFV